MHQEKALWYPKECNVSIRCTTIAMRLIFRCSYRIISLTAHMKSGYNCIVDRPLHVKACNRVGEPNWSADITRTLGLPEQGVLALRSV